MGNIVVNGGLIFSSQTGLINCTSFYTISRRFFGSLTTSNIFIILLLTVTIDFLLHYLYEALYSHSSLNSKSPAFEVNFMVSFTYGIKFFWLLAQWSIIINEIYPHYINNSPYYITD